MRSVRFEIRAKTQGAHEAVDAVFDRFDLCDPAGYAAFLRAHHRALSGVPLDPTPYGLPALGLLPLLEADLAALGTPTPSLPPLSLESEDERLGAYYVVTGSRLGGRLIERRWREAGGDGPAAYLGDRTTDGCWRALLDLLEGGTFCISSVERGALACFDRFRIAGLAELPEGALI